MGTTRRDVDALRTGYDAVCDEYVTRFRYELDHKPFDRALLDRFTQAVRGAGPAACLKAGNRMGALSTRALM